MCEAPARASAGRRLGRGAGVSLVELSVRGLGTVEHAVLEPGGALTAVTGESGAGKSMLMLGLALLGGAKADAALLREDSGRIRVEARFRTGAGDPAVARALEAGAELDDGELLVGRDVMPTGRSRCHVGGCSVPLTLLAEVSSGLLQMTSQSAQVRLARPAEQRDALDRYAGDEALALLHEYEQVYVTWRAAVADLHELTGRRRASAVEAELLRAQLTEVEQLDPQPGEDAALAEEADRLQAAATLATSALGAVAAIAGDERSDDGCSALTAVSAARAALSGASDLDDALGEVSARLAGIAAELGDAASTLAARLQDLAPDESRLGQVAERRAALRRLTRAHGLDVDALLGWAADAAQRLADHDGAESRLDALVAQEKSRREALLVRAARLTGLRRTAAGKLATEVTATLADLAMPQARLDVRIQPLAPQWSGGAGGAAGAAGAAGLGAHGADDVALLLQAHPASPPQPLGRGASGGELSRVLLALEVALSDARQSSTLVFDEIDAGVGGRTAAEVGRLLARLGGRRQVLCVTHLPQVAAFAEQHVLVHRDRSAPGAPTVVTALEGTARVTELSRMLAGVDDSKLARGHARELLAAAARGER